jgi:hypothetical protein
MVGETGGRFLLFDFFFPLLPDDDPELFGPLAVLLPLAISAISNDFDLLFRCNLRC